MSVAVDTAAAQEAKEPPASDSDSPTSTAIDLGLNQVDDVNVDVEPAEEDTENVEWRANGVADESAVATGEQRPNKKRRRVSFECADIVEFEPTVNAIIQNRRESNEIDVDFMYGSSEMEDYEDEVEEEEAEESNVLSYDGVGDELPEESEEEQEDIVEEDAAAMQHVASASTSDEGSVEQEELPASSETTVQSMQRRCTGGCIDLDSATPCPRQQSVLEFDRDSSPAAAMRACHNLVLQVVSIAPTVEKKRYDAPSHESPRRCWPMRPDASRSLRETVCGWLGRLMVDCGDLMCALCGFADQIDMLKEGLVVVVRNSNADIFNGFMRLNVTQWGKLSLHPDGVASTPPPPPSVNTENNISAVEYELVTVDDADE
ncbi:Nucleic acid-binding, OB-fold [Phytophthora cactorum]|nr:Nucleic acid-binding, OB-fold [Phytophthora cactorum]